MIDPSAPRHEAFSGRSAEFRFTRRSVTGVNPLTVRCTWCHAGVVTRCTIPGTQIQLEEHPPMRTGFHPARSDAAAARKALETDA
jgi:hypothetical protein